jgi:hypothetical protein
MTLRSPVLAALVVVLVGLTSALQGAPQRSTAAGPAPRAADAVVANAAGTIALDLPANIFTAQLAFRRVLDAAGVRYGLEGPVWDPNVPFVDLSRVREDSLQLKGRRLGDALDALVKAVPQYRWTETDGVIVVRATQNGQSLLDRRIPRFTLANATPRIAIEAVIAAIDPARPRGQGIQGFGRPGTGAGTAPEKIGRNVTLNLTNATVQTILSAVARANGAMTWTVQYDHMPASPETTTIALTEYSETVTAQSPAAFRDALAPPTAVRQLQIATSMPAMLSTYAVRTPSLKLSVEEAAASPELAMYLAAPLAPGVPPLDLPDDPAQAIARIVAFDSRYEWSQTNGRFRVRPRAGVPGRIDLLDNKIDGFSATNESARSVIERAARAVGMVRPAPTPPAAVAARGPSPIDTAMATPISIALAGQVTPRDVFDAIADVTGWSWSLRPTFIPGQPTRLSVQWRGRNVTPPTGSATSGPAMVGPSGSYSGPNWSTSVTITATTDMSPTPTPSRRPARPIPAALDRDIPQLSVSQPAGVSPFRELLTDVRLPLNIEELPPPAQLQDPRRMTRPKPPIVVGPGKFSDALYVLIERVPGYEVVSTDGAVTVAPTSLLKSSDYFMNRPLPTFAVNNVGLFRAVGELRRALDPKFEPRDWDSGGGEVMNKPVSLSVRNAAPREILNQLTRLHGDLVWMSSFRPRADRADARVEDWVVTLTPISAPGPIVSLAPAGGVPASTLQPRISRPPLPGSPVTLDLPVTPTSLRLSLSAMGRSIGTPIGFENVAVEMPATPTPLERPSDYYDLSGLGTQELIDKLQELAPEYQFRLINGVYRVQPRVAQSLSTSWLDQPIDRFEQRFENLRDAMYAVAAIGRPTAMGGRGAAPSAPTAAPQPVSPGLASLNERLQKTLVLSLTNTTVRDILDEIARQFGRLMWSVEQRTSPLGTTSVSLTFSGYDGWSTGTSVR